MARRFDRDPRPRAPRSRDEPQDASDGDDPPVKRQRTLPPGKTAEDLIGSVRPLSNPRVQRLCSHFQKDDCLWGDQCRFSHDANELRVGAPVTEGMTFSNLEVGQVATSMSIPRNQIPHFMTENTRRLLTDASGVSEVVWDLADAQVTICGTAQQVECAEQLVKRVVTHCKWGVNEAKVHGLLSPRPVAMVRIRLSPMVPALKQMVFNLSATKRKVSIGSHSSNDLIVKAPLISRTHAMLELILSKGAVYAVDMSTNGTFLNGVKLPSKSTGKVILFHGDELLFPEANNQGEFGYIVNLETMS